MREQKSERRYKQSVINGVILFAVFALFIYFSVQLSNGFSTSLSTQRTQVVTDTDYVYLGGYVFRDETVATQASVGVCDYLVADGERVGVHQPYATFYAMSGESAGKIAEAQAKLNDLSDRIERLSLGVSIGSSAAGLAHVNEILSTSYYSYVNSVLSGDFTSANAHGDLVLRALVNYSVITGRDGVAEDISSSLKQEKQELLDSIGGGNTLVSDEGFYFFRKTDGYESVFNSKALDGLTPSDLSSLADQSAEKYGSETVGRYVHSTKWYLALPTDEATCLLFSVGLDYELTFSGEGNKTAPMTLENICLEEGGNGYLLFSSRDLSVAGNFDRNQSVKIKMGALSGYRVPSESLTTVNGERGVYILVGNVVEFRRVTVIGEGRGYYIVATYESDSNEGSVSKTPYLYINDLIITSGNDLYDGKLIN